MNEEMVGVERVPDRSAVVEVARCTATAAHGRDHDHVLGGQCCHPHAVEVIHLGLRAFSICHDCHADTGFLPSREAERLAEGHREQTRGTGVSRPFAQAS